MKQFENASKKDFFSNELVCLSFIFIFVFLIVFPVLYWGIPDGFDLPQHFQFAQTYLDSIKDGNFLPAWSAHTNHGLGDVGIRFYPPLAHYCLAITQLLTGDWQTSAAINILLWMLLGSIGSFHLARLWLTPQNSLWVGILYALAPYHLSQIYQYFLYSEFVGAAILPFCFLYLTKICRGGDWKSSVKFGTALAFLILSHIPTSIVGVVCLGIYGLFVLNPNNFRKSFPKLLVSGLIGLALTAFYWVKLVTEINWVNHSSPRFASGQYDYQQYLFPIFSNFNELYIIKQMWLRDIVSISTIVFILPLSIFLLLKIKSLTDHKEFLGIIAAGLFAIFMSSHLSSSLWANLPLLPKIQFPFRWLSGATILGVISFVIFFQYQNLKLPPRVVNYSLIVFFLFISIFDLTQIILPAGLLTKEDFAERISGLKEKESFDCWWTIWAKSSAFSESEKVAAGDRKVKIIKWDSEIREFEIESGKTVEARIASFYYPYWNSVINSEQSETKLNQDGTISLLIPEESVKVSLFFVEPLSIRAAKLISTLSWFLLIIALCFTAIAVTRRTPFSLRGVN